MTMFYIWLLWSVDFIVFTGIMIMRLVSVLSLRQQKWYVPQFFFVLFGLASVSGGVFMLIGGRAPTLAAPANPIFIVLVGAMCVFVGIGFVRELSRFAAFRAGRVASAHIVAHRYAEAEIIYERLLKRYPKKAVMWVNKGIILLSQDRIDEALAVADHALTLAPKYVPALNLKAASLAEKHQYTEALATCDHALTLSPKDATAWGWKARVLERSGHLEEALAACDQALQLTVSGNTDAIRGAAWSTKAIVLNAQGRYAEALTAVENAVRLHPRPVKPRLAQAIALTHLGRPEDAQIAAEQGLVVADQLLVERPRNVDTWQVKKDLLRFLGREAEADAADKHMHALLSQMQSTTS